MGTIHLGSLIYQLSMFGFSVVLEIGRVHLRRLPMNENLRQALLMFITQNLF